MFPGKKSTIITVVSLLLLCTRLTGLSQTFSPGVIYRDTTGYVEYRAGNLPLIISAPHGGSVQPDSIPDRTCSGCVTVKDSYTQEIAEGLYDEIYRETGCYPHVIINLLHRKKFDANRDIGDAANGNPYVEQAWYAYHRFIDSAGAKIVRDYGRGLFLDIHGHGHALQRIELGYLLSKSDLQESNSILNSGSFAEKSSIRSLAVDNIQHLDFAGLLRGTNSFGTLMDEQGFPSVPSTDDPFPLESESYFSGGYNTQRHGSRDNEGEIDAIQLELNHDIRFNEFTRDVFIETLSQTALEYYHLHYNNQFTGNYCTLVTGSTRLPSGEQSVTLSPNPAHHVLMINSHLDHYTVMIYNGIGQPVLHQEASFNTVINLRALETGFYIVRIIKDGTVLGKEKLIIKK